MSYKFLVNLSLSCINFISDLNCWKISSFSISPKSTNIFFSNSSFKLIPLSIQSFKNINILIDGISIFNFLP